MYKYILKNTTLFILSWGEREKEFMHLAQKVFVRLIDESGHALVRN